MKICCSELFKIAQSGHTAQTIFSLLLLLVYSVSLSDTHTFSLSNILSLALVKCVRHFLLSFTLLFNTKLACFDCNTFYLSLFSHVYTQVGRPVSINANVFLTTFTKTLTRYACMTNNIYTFTYALAMQVYECMPSQQCSYTKECMPSQQCSYTNECMPSQQCSYTKECMPSQQRR